MGVVIAIIRRAIVPVVLAIAGLVAIVEGVLYHPIRVLVETETEEEDRRAAADAARATFMTYVLRGPCRSVGRPLSSEP